MSQHHDKFKLFHGTVATIADLQTLLNTSAAWALAIGATPKSIGAVDLTYEDILVNIGYDDSKEPVAVKFLVKEIGNCDHLGETKAIEEKLNHSEDEIEGVICHELVVLRIEEVDVLVMVIMLQA